MTERRNAVEQALAEWRAAERAVEETDDAAPERDELTATAARMAERYQLAVLASRGRIDQLAAAAEDSWERVGVSRDRAELSEAILRRR